MRLGDMSRSMHGSSRSRGQGTRGLVRWGNLRSGHSARRSAAAVRAWGIGGASTVGLECFCCWRMGAGGAEERSPLSLVEIRSSVV